MSPILTYRFVAFFALLFCALFSVGPILDGGSRGSSVSALFFDDLCHQDPARSFQWFGVHWTVCHRCAAIYLAFLGIALVILQRAEIGAKRKARSAGERVLGKRLFIALMTPILLDAGLDFVGVWDATFVTRLVSGSLAGVAMGWLVIPLLAEGMLGLKFKPGGATHSKKVDSSQA